MVRTITAPFQVFQAFPRVPMETGGEGHQLVVVAGRKDGRHQVEDADAETHRSV